MVHLRPHLPLFHFPATCSSAWLSGLAALHFLSQPRYVCFALAEVGVVDVLDTVHPLPVVHLGHQFHDPAKLLNK